MALTNAERQARYRARLKEKASGGALMTHVDKAADEAVEALWSFFNRPDPDGQPWADIDGCNSVAEYRLATRGQLIETCRALIWSGAELHPEEAAALARVIEISERLEMKASTPAD